MSRRNKLIGNFFSPPTLNSSLTPSLSPQCLIDEKDLEWSYKDQEIGKGAYGSIFKGKFKESIVAIKVYTLDNVSLPYNQRMLINLVVELKKLNHENVVKCHGLCPRKGAIIMELAEKKIELGDDVFNIHSLRQLISTVETVLPLELLKESLYQIARGLAYLHCQNVIHGDLKSSNVLVTGKTPEEYRFILTDFGQPHQELTLTSMFS